MKMIEQDRAKAAQQLLGMNKGDQIVYSSGSTVGVYGSAMYCLGEKGLFCLTQKPERPPRGHDDHRSFRYIATRTGKKITQDDVSEAMTKVFTVERFNAS